MKTRTLTAVIIIFALLEIIGMNAHFFMGDDKELIRRQYHLSIAFNTLAWSFIIQELARFVHGHFKRNDTFTLWIVCPYIMLLKVVNFLDELAGMNAQTSIWEWVGVAMATIFVGYTIFNHKKNH